MVVSEKALAYYEERLKRLEENKKKLDELKLKKLSQSLRNPTSPMTSPMKKVKPRVPVDFSAVRRSRRVADKPPPNYKEGIIEPLGKLRRYNYRKRDLSNRVYASDEDRENAQERAEELQSGLDTEIPSFVKPMLQSHVTGGFWLGLPVQFCKTYLPTTHDETITLVDEDEEEFPTKYLYLKTGLSGGWRGFAIDHELVDGDALVFQLIEPTRFKVYIVRVNQPEEGN